MQGSIQRSLLCKVILCSFYKINRAQIILFCKEFYCNNFDRDGGSSFPHSLAWPCLQILVVIIWLFRESANRALVIVLSSRQFLRL